MQISFLTVPEQIQKNYFTIDGFPNYELILMGNLMSETGIYSITKVEDLKLLAYRTYLLYEIYILWENLLLEDIFFFGRLSANPYNDEKIIDLALSTIKEGVKYPILTTELPNFIGLKISKKEPVTDEIFFAKNIKNCNPFWQLKNGHILFPGAPRNYRLRNRIKDGKKPLKKTISDAEKWANEIVKYNKTN